VTRCDEPGLRGDARAPTRAWFLQRALETSQKSRDTGDTSALRPLRHVRSIAFPGAWSLRVGSRYFQRHRRETAALRSIFGPSAVVGGTGCGRGGAPTTPIMLLQLLLLLEIELIFHHVSKSATPPDRLIAASIRCLSPWKPHSGLH
jgi:hypothetical protein